MRGSPSGWDSGFQPLSQLEQRVAELLRRVGGRRGPSWPRPVVRAAYRPRGPSCPRPVVPAAYRPRPTIARHVNDAAVCATRGRAPRDTEAQRRARDRSADRSRAIGRHLRAPHAAGRAADKAWISRARPAVVHLMCDFGAGASGPGAGACHLGASRRGRPQVQLGRFRPRRRRFRPRRRRLRPRRGRLPSRPFAWDRPRSDPRCRDRRKVAGALAAE